MPPSRSPTIEFPRRQLRECVDVVRKLHPQGEFSKMDLDKAFGFKTQKSTSAGSSRGAMVMYGLLHRDQGSYFLSDLGKAIRNPLGNQAENLLPVSFLTSSKFRQVYMKLKKQTIPRRRYLSNYVLQTYSVTDKVARKFERVFIDSGKLCGLITEVDKKILRFWMFLGISGNSVSMNQISPSFQRMSLKLQKTSISL